MQEARAKAYNIVSDFVSYLSLLLDVCFYDPQSIYRNFVRLSYDSHYQRIIAQERYRTAFIDNETAHTLFKGLIFTDIVLPIVAYAMMLMYKYLSGRNH